MKNHNRNKTLLTPKYRLKRLFFDQRTGEIYDSLQELRDKRELNIKALRLFLLLGYVPGNATLFQDIICLPGGCKIEIDQDSWKILNRSYIIDSFDLGRYSKYTEKELIDIGGDVFIKSVSSLYKKDIQNIVPLSGGYDSRAILAALLEFSDAKNIITYTFGTPGTYEYETGNKIAKIAGTQHISFDLSKTTLNQEKLNLAAQMTDGNTNIMQPVFLIDILKQFNQTDVIWSGFTGDGIGGSHYNPNGEMIFEKAISKYISSEYTGLISKNNEISNYDLVEIDSIYNGVLNIEEDLFFTNHVERYTVNHLFFPNYTYLCPFMEDNFVEFMFGIPKGYRKNKYLFNEIMKKKFPSLFQYPTKIELASRPLNRVYNKALKTFLFLPFKKMTTNYVDYRVFLKSNYHDLLMSNLQDLNEKRILQNFNINSEKILNEHMSNRRDHSAELSLLVSLNTIINTFSD